MSLPAGARVASRRKSTVTLVPELNFDPGLSRHSRDHASRHPLSGSVLENGSIVSIEGSAADLGAHRNPSVPHAATEGITSSTVLSPDFSTVAAGTARTALHPSREGTKSSAATGALGQAECVAVDTVASLPHSDPPPDITPVPATDSNLQDASAPARKSDAPTPPDFSANGHETSSTLAKIHVPMRFACAAVLCAATPASDPHLRNTFWSLLTGETQSTPLVRSFRCIIEPEISGRKNVWVRALDADPLCYLSAVLSRANLPPITHFTVINASTQPEFIDSVYLRDIRIFIIPFDLDPFLGNDDDENDALDASALIMNSLVSLFQRIATLCVRYGANGDFAAPSVILAGVSSSDLSDAHTPVLQLVSDTVFHMLNGSFVSLGLIECSLDSSSCLWFYPMSSSNSYGLTAIQDALCTFFHGHAIKTFTAPQHWFHLITSLRQNSQPVIPISAVQSLAAECFALDVPSNHILPELERFINFCAEHGVARRSATARDLFVIDGALFDWQSAAAVLYHDGSIKHPGQQLQSNSRRVHQQAYHSFLSTGQLTADLLKSFASSEAIACHAAPMLIASGLIVPLCASDHPYSSETFAVLPLMPKISSESIQQQLTHAHPCLSFICFIYTCDAPSRLLRTSSVTTTASMFALRFSPFYVIPRLWAALRVMVLDELALGMESIVMSSAVFACTGTATAPFYIEHDSRNHVLRLTLHGASRDMLLSRITSCFSRALTAFPFISHAFAIESLQFPSCASVPPSLLSLPKVLHCAASGTAFQHNAACIAHEELFSVLGSSSRDAPWISICIVYSPASLTFARAVCNSLSLSRVANMPVHCWMVRGSPFTQPDTYIADAVHAADHVVILAEQQELAAALHVQPHSCLASHLLTLHNIFSQRSSLSFSSCIISDGSPLTPASQSQSDRTDDFLAALLESSSLSSSPATSAVRHIITKFFLGSERLPFENCAADSVLDSSQAIALSSSVLHRLNNLLQARVEDAKVFQREFSTVTLESDSAFHLSSSIELDVSAVSRMDASSHTLVPLSEPRDVHDDNLDDCMSQSNHDDDGDDDSDGHDFDQEYDSDTRGVSDSDGAVFPPRPPTPPEDDEILELQTLILSLSASPLARAEAGDEASEASFHPANVSTVTTAAPKNDGFKRSAAVALAAEDSFSFPPTKNFLKKGTNSARQRQRRAELSIALSDSSPKQPRPPHTAAQSPSSRSSLSLSPSTLSSSHAAAAAGLPSPRTSKSPPPTRNSPRRPERSNQNAATSPQPARAAVEVVPVPPRDPYPADAHPRLTMLLPELCFDRSPGAAHRLISSWLDEGRVCSTRSRAMRLVCLCEMHIARPQGPSSSPMILWHRCAHMGFPIAASKEPEAIRACAETTREVLTMARLAGVSSRIFGSAQHYEVLERNMGEWNHANDAAANPRAFQDDDHGPEAAALTSPAPLLARSPVASRSSLSPSSASPYLSDVPVGIKANDVTRFAPSFSRDNTRLQYMRIADHGLKMFHGDMWLCPDHYELVDLYQKGQISIELLVSSSLAVEISKLPPFDTTSHPSQRSHTHTPSTALPWVHSSIISSIAATVAQPLQSPSRAATPADTPPQHSAPQDSATRAQHAASPAAVTASVNDGNDVEQSNVERGCVPPALRDKCRVL